jgi:rhodanese-related sulfurtransferase
MKTIFKFIVLSIMFGALSGAFAVWLINSISANQTKLNNQNSLIENFYLTENAVHISPHSIRKAIAKHDDNFILVDLRSQQEYEQEHIVGAVSIPAYKDPNTSAYDEVDRIVSSFAKLPADKDIIVYCYSIPCMTGRKIGKLLTEHGIYVKLLGVGWNEWRYFWNLWNHEHEWDNTDVRDYIATGSEPGEFSGQGSSDVCPLEGDLGC